MKRVRKQELENLIVQFYSEFVKFQSYDLLEVKMYDTYIFFKDFSDFESKEDAIAFLVKHYERMTTYDYKEKGVLVKYEDVKRTVTKFDSVKEGLTYKEFNLYINNLDVYKKNSKKRR